MSKVAIGLVQPSRFGQWSWSDKYVRSLLAHEGVPNGHVINVYSQSTPAELIEELGLSSDNNILIYSQIPRRRYKLMIKEYQRQYSALAKGLNWLLASPEAYRCCNAISILTRILDYTK